MDANILMRAVLGKGARRLLACYSSPNRFLAPESAFLEAAARLPSVIERHQLPSDQLMAYFESLDDVVVSIAFKEYAAFESEARLRIARRDVDDWPVVAAALSVNCPIWTEDLDFFGCGVATWTSDRVELYLAAAQDV